MQIHNNFVHLANILKNNRLCWFLALRSIPLHLPRPPDPMPPPLPSSSAALSGFVHAYALFAQRSHHSKCGYSASGTLRIIIIFALCFASSSDSRCSSESSIEHVPHKNHLESLFSACWCKRLGTLASCKRSTPFFRTLRCN